MFQCFSAPSPRAQMSPWKGAKLTGKVRVKKRIRDHVGQWKRVIVLSDFDYAFASLLSAFTN